MGDRVAVMKDGVLQQCDTPRVLYADPLNAFVAGFIGSPPMNLVSGVVTDDGISVGSTLLDAVSGLPAQPGRQLTVGLRPEALQLGGPGEGIPATVTLVEELGAEAFVHAGIDDDASVTALASSTVVARVEPHLAPAKGERINLHPKPGAMLFFEVDTGERIRTLARAGDLG